ncbi:hypothetical protein [Leptotrichia trevisanii]|uniref:hypothetical protein n=1 Tax=Leptotrichia trevisanii TaxID=109328 RepID=UPI0003FCF20F|nr:hypothetical protein [Leptotrichia trevisanii]
MTGIEKVVGTAVVVTAGVVAVAEGINQTVKLMNETVNTADDMFTTMGRQKILVTA